MTTAGEALALYCCGDPDCSELHSQGTNAGSREDLDRLSLT